MCAFAVILGDGARLLIELLMHRCIVSVEWSTNNSFDLNTPEDAFNRNKSLGWVVLSLG